MVRPVSYILLNRLRARQIFILDCVVNEASNEKLLYYTFNVFLYEELFLFRLHCNFHSILCISLVYVHQLDFFYFSVSNYFNCRVINFVGVDHSLVYLQIYCKEHYFRVQINLMVPH